MKATISANQSQSDILDLYGTTILAIQMPSSWTAANLTFLGCDDINGTFVPIYDSAGNELVAVAASSRLVVDLPELSPVRYLKIRSGTAATPVIQTQRRELIIHCK